MTEPVIDKLEELRRVNEAAPMTGEERVQTLERIHATVRGRPRRPLLFWSAGLTSAGAAAVALLLSVLPSGAWYHGVAGMECLNRAGEELRVDANCRIEPQLRLASFRVDLKPGTSMRRRAEHHVRLEQGVARFARDHKGERFRIDVSHGAVEVTGTVFTVSQASGEGQLQVHSGRVEFVWRDTGDRQEVTGGSSLRWPRVDETGDVESTEEKEKVEPSRTSPRPAATKRNSPQATGQEILDELLRTQLQLRGQRRYDEAMTLLRKGTANKKLTRRQRERLSAELGHLLEKHGERQAVCKHWKTHLERFSKVPGRAEIERYLATNCR